jgi:hypothetical protein
LGDATQGAAPVGGLFRCGLRFVKSNLHRKPFGFSPALNLGFVPFAIHARLARIRAHYVFIRNVALNCC